MPRKPKYAGKRPMRGKWQAFVFAGGRMRSKSFPLNAPEAELEAWRKTERAKYTEPEDVDGSIAADIPTYRKLVHAMPTIEQRITDLERWAGVLGRDRHRSTVTDLEVTAAMQNELAAGLAPATVRKRRTALLSFYTTMNGKTGFNPVRGTPIPKGAKPEALGLDYESIERALAAMPVDRIVGPKPRPVGRRPHPCPAPLAGGLGRCGASCTNRYCSGACKFRAWYWRSRTPEDARPGDRLEAGPILATSTPRLVRLNLAPIRARVLAYTGIPPGMLMKVEPEDLRLTGPRPTVRIRARRKTGVEARTLPIVGPEALAAWRAFHEAGAYGEFATGALNVSFKRGWHNAGLPPGAYLYRLRHSFLSELYRVTRDDATVGRFGMHVEGSRVTRRYHQAAHADVNRAAAKAMGEALAAARKRALRTAAKVHVKEHTLRKNIAHLSTKPAKPGTRHELPRRASAG